MPILDDPYTVRERQSRLVGYQWKHIILTFLALSSVGGVVCCVTLYNIHSHFRGNCFLSAEIIGYTNDNKSIVLSLSGVNQTKWGDMNTCNLAIYSPLSLGIFAMLWLSMFIICGRGGRSPGKYGPPQAWLIVTPACCFSIVPLIFGFYVSSAATVGIKRFCESLTSLCNGCSYLDLYTWENFESLEKLGSKINVSLVSLWVCSGSWFFVFIILLLRCIAHPDFEISKQIPLRSPGEPLTSSTIE